MTETQDATAGAAPFEAGTLIKHRGQVWTVDGYVGADEADDVVPFYYVSAPERGEYGQDVTASEAEFFMSAADAAKRTVPTVEAIRRFLGELCGEETEEFEVDEVGPVDETTVELAGSTSDGLRFAARVRVLDVRQTDF